MLIDGSLSYDPDSNQDLTYIWSVMLGTENIPTTAIGNGSMTNLSVDKAGTYSIRLTVYDGDLNSASLEPEELGPWEITAYATNTGDEDRIACEWYMESEIWLQGCRHVIHEWPLGDRDERVATLIVIDNDGSQSSTQFKFTQQDNTSDDTLVFLILSILTLSLIHI